MKYRTSFNTARNSCLMALLLPLVIPIAGCSTTGETVAVAIAGTTGATLIATQVATESKIGVEVDVYIPDDKDNARFKLSRETALRRQIQQMQLDDIGSFQAIATQLDGPMQALADQRVRAGEFVDGLDQLLAPRGEVNDEDPGDATPNAAAVADGADNGDEEDEVDKQAQETVDSLRAWLTKQDAVLRQWNLFDIRLKQAKAQTKPAKQDLEDLRVRISALRDALASLSQSGLPGSYLREVAGATSAAIDKGIEKAAAEAMIGEALKGKILEAFREGEGLSDLLESVIEKSENRSVKEQLALATSAAFQHVLELKIMLDEGEEVDFGRYKEVYASSREVVNAILEALRDDSFGPTVAEWGVTLNEHTVARATSITDANHLKYLFLGLPDELFLSDAGTLVAAIQTTAKAGYQVTYSALTADVNLGPIVNEVMQSVMTVKAIDVITKPDQPERWQRFAEAYSKGRTGNHDVVIYFENMGKPILKSSAFDPTKFVVANGQLFQQAFFALADVYGLPTGAAQGTQADTNLINLRNQRDDALAKAKGEREKLQEALRTLLDTEDYSDTSKVQEKIKAAANKLDKAEPATVESEAGEDET